MRRHIHGERLTGDGFPVRETEPYEWVKKSDQSYTEVFYWTFVRIDFSEYCVEDVVSSEQTTRDIGEDLGSTK